MKAVFCSKRDLAQAFEKALNTDRNFTVAFAVSNNDGNVFDLSKQEESWSLTHRIILQNIFSLDMYATRIS